jgi:hypothetical protein
MLRALFMVLWLLVGVGGRVLHAQSVDTTEVVRLTLTDGTVVVGYVLAEDGATVQFRTASGVMMQIPQAQIRRREVLLQQGTGRYVRLDPNRTRLLFASTARSLPSGKGYVGVYEVLFPFVAVGVADRLVLAGGMSLLPGASEQLVYLAPKLTVRQTPKAQVAAGVIAARVTRNEGAAGLLYGNGTFGSPERAVTLGVGFAFVSEGLEDEDDLEVSDTPVLLIGGELQVSNSLKLLTENYVGPALDEAALLSAGVRFFGEHLAADLGLFTSPAAWDADGFPFIPWVGFVYNW